MRNHRPGVASASTAVVLSLTALTLTPAAADTITASPTSFDFGTVTVGNAVTEPFDITIGLSLGDIFLGIEITTTVLFRAALSCSNFLILVCAAFNSHRSLRDFLSHPTCSIAAGHTRFRSRRLLQHRSFSSRGAIDQWFPGPDREQ
jgi:hypothetical protein